MDDRSHVEVNDREAASGAARVPDMPVTTVRMVLPQGHGGAGMEMARLDQMGMAEADHG